MDIYFEEPVSPETHKKAALSINLWQPDLTRSKYPVYPSNGKKLMQMEKKSKSSGRSKS